MLASLGMSVFFVTGWMLYLDRRRKKRALRAARKVLQGAAPASQAAPWLIAFASQSGFAERLAWQAAGHLQAAGLPVQVRSLAQLDAQALQRTGHALFVISTFGDGEPPDAARGFERGLLRQRLELPHLAYAVLALGDRQYAQFCGFSRRVEQWLDAQGARALFPAVELDNVDPQALAHWHAQLGQIAGAPMNVAPLARPRLTEWTLSSRTHLNPGSQGRRSGVSICSHPPMRSGRPATSSKCSLRMPRRRCAPVWRHGAWRRTHWCMWMRSCCHCSRLPPSAYCPSRPRCRLPIALIRKPGWTHAPGCPHAIIRSPAYRLTPLRWWWCG